MIARCEKESFLPVSDIPERFLQDLPGPNWLSAPSRSIDRLWFELDRFAEIHHIYIILVFGLRGLFPYSIIMNLSSDYGSDFDGPSAYQITVLGTIMSSWSERLEGMGINRLVLEDGTTYTVLTGDLTDQAALTGVLNTIYELHLPLVAVHKLQTTGSRREEFPPDG